MVVVFGSINLDLVARVPRFAVPGETLAGESFATHPGGKGANQALAAARSGARVALIGAVGHDAFADPALALLQSGGVDLTRVRRVDGATGVALIAVDAAGQNSIVIVAGANAHVDPSDVPDDWLTPSCLLVLQNEVPAAANAAIATRAASRNTPILYNAAPARSVDAASLRSIDVLVVNEAEMAELARAHGLDLRPEVFVADYARRFEATAIVTLGAAGAIAADRQHRYRVPAPNVEVVDTTGAGDAFVGALAAALDRVDGLDRALAFAAAAGSLACTAEGAQPALPGADRISALAATISVERSTAA
jgi:ribokinase